MIKLKFITGLLALFTISSFSLGQNNLENNDATERPNILWITCEDISPYLGSYGCKEAQKPNLDRLAERGIRNTHTLNAFQYSETDNQLTLDDWKRFKEKKFPANDAGASLCYPNRIIDDAIALWPNRRKVY